MKKLDVSQSFFSDFEFLVAKIKEVHPDPFTHVSEKHFVSSAYKRIATCESKLSFLKVLCRQLALLKDAHTSAGLPNNETSSLPKYSISVAIKNGVVWLNEANNKTVTKQKILFVNETPIKLFLKEVKTFISAERASYSMALLEKHLGYFIALYFEKDRVQLQTEKENIFLVPLRAKTIHTKQENYLLRFQNDLAIIEIKNFVDGEQASLFFAETFQILKTKKTKHLAIDLRSNSGGNTAIAAELISYFFSKKMKFYEKSIVRYSETRWAYYQQCDWLNDLKHSDAAFYKTLISKKNWGENIIESEVEKRLPKRQNFFTGNVYLLTSKYTFSAAADLAWAFKHYKMGKIIGEEAGGIGASFGDIITVQLPNSGILAYLSHKKIYCVGACELLNRGVMPDVKTNARNAVQLLLKR